MLDLPDGAVLTQSQGMRESGAVNRAGLVTDLLIALDPALAGIPYDDTAKAVNVDGIAERRGELGVPECGLDVVEPYRSVGDPVTAAGGPSDLLVALADDLARQLEDARSRAGLARDIADKQLDNHLRAVYRPYLDRVADPGAVVTPARSSVGPALGKLAQFACLA